MAKVTLVVCLRGERELLARLLDHATNCYDDLVVVHDGGDDSREMEGSIPPIDFSERAVDSAVSPYRAVAGNLSEESSAGLIAAHSGRFFEGPRAFEQEPHWPFAWSQAKYDWILRLDADELLSEPLRAWLKDFRNRSESGDAPSGYSCIWPLWNGKEATSDVWPAGRLFLFDRRKVRFFGMAEQTPVPDGEIVPLNLILHHRPLRKSYGVRNILFRSQAYRWRRKIAGALMESPMALPRWRWHSSEWPSPWKEKIKNPLLTSFKALIWYSLCQARSLWKAGLPIDISACLNPGLHHFMLGLEIWRKQCK